MDYKERVHALALKEAEVRFTRKTWAGRDQESRDMEARKYYKEAERILTYCTNWYRAGLEDGEDNSYTEEWANRQCLYHGLAPVH